MNGYEFPSREYIKDKTKLQEEPIYPLLRGPLGRPRLTVAHVTLRVYGIGF